ncbi:protein of unknown function [Shewanella benthica]|uniref:Uncharacterized protein n=1 Tax=Shewanella benthica TaxID=43661 RepID=A0A330M000_9GAMM|nr:protein of unknown function [Shewanella benthica]
MVVANFIISVAWAGMPVINVAAKAILKIDFRFNMLTPWLF